MKLFKKFVAPFIVFSISFITSYWLQFHTKFFAGYDSYYHVKLAKIISYHGLIYDFPWLQYTVLKDRYADIHLLFHILLIPFLKLGIFLGPKLAIVILQGLIFTTFYLILKANRIPFALIWTLSLFTMPWDFFYRMNLIRVPPLALFLLLLSVHFLLREKYLWLALILYIYVLCYVGFVIYLVILFFYIFFYFLDKKKFAIKPLFFSLIAILLALISHPYFPNILYYLKVVLIKSGPSPQIPVGSEWYPYDMKYFLRSSSYCLIFFVISIAIVLFQRRKLTVSEKTLFSTSLFLFLMTISTRRVIEYWPLFVMLSISFITAPYMRKLEEQKYYKRGMVILLLIGGTFNLLKARNFILPALQIAPLRDAILYIKNNSSPGEIVFTDDWDVFPYYFFFNSKNYYIVGLDPVFLYIYDEELYKKFVTITIGESVTLGEKVLEFKQYGNVENIVKEFLASWVILDKEHKNLLLNLSRSNYFKLVYQNKNYYVYKVVQR